MRPQRQRRSSQHLKDVQSFRSRQQPVPKQPVSESTHTRSIVRYDEIYEPAFSADFSASNMLNVGSKFSLFLLFMLLGNACAEQPVIPPRSSRDFAVAPSSGIFICEATGNCAFFASQPSQPMIDRVSLRDKITAGTGTIAQGDMEYTPYVMDPSAHARIEKIVIDQIMQLTRSDECSYINFVLRHPDFRIFILYPPGSDTCRSKHAGEYYSTINSIVLHPHFIIDDAYFTTVLRHEFWHAYQCLSRQDEAARETELATAPFTTASDRRAIQKAIATGMRRVLKTFPALRNKPPHLLTDTERESLTRFNAAAKSYSPRKHQVTLTPQMIRQLLTESDGTREDLLAALSNHDITLFNIGKARIPLYSRKIIECKADGSIVVQGCFTPASQPDRAMALIHDTQLLHDDILQKYSHQIRSDAELTEITEQDADIMSNPVVIQETFYPELRAYHESHTQRLLATETNSPRLS